MNTKLKLVIAGSGNKKDISKLKKLIQKFDLSDKVEFTGYVKGKEKEELMQNASFIVCPSRYEEFSISLMESFCYAKAVITSNIPQNSWTPKNGCIKIDPNDVEDLASAMKSLYLHPDKARKIGKVAKKEMSKYNWDNSTKLYSQALDLVLKDHTFNSNIILNKSK